MMKYFVILAIAVLYSCNTKIIDNRKQLTSEGENVVHLGDKLVVFTSSCKGCEFETTYRFTDSLGIIKQVESKSYDDCPDCDGGSYRVEVEFIPLKTGRTVLKMWAISEKVITSEGSDDEEIEIIEESTLVGNFIIEVKDK